MNLDVKTVFKSQGRDQSIDYLILVAYRFFFDLKDQSKDFWTSDLSSDIDAGGSCHWSWLALPGSKSKTLGLFEGRGNGPASVEMGRPYWETLSKW